MERQWQYLAQGGDSKGPFPEWVVLRMLVKGIPGLDLQCYAWCAGMAEWAPFAALEPFKGVMEAQSNMWYYLDEAGAQQGPIDAMAVSKHWDEGDIDGMTLVWHGAMPEWKPVGEVPELRQLLQILSTQQDDEDEEDGGNGTNAVDERMVFQEDEIPTLSSVLKDNKDEEDEEDEDENNKGGKDGAGKGKTGTKKTFVGDDGVRYKFNEQSQDWEEANSGEGYETDDEDMGVGESENGGEDADGLPGRPKNKKKDTKEEGGAATKEGEGGKEQDESEAAKKQKKKKKSRKKRGLEWDDRAKNRWVYVSGLPTDITVEELDQHFRQVGVIALDPETQLPKIKLYKDEHGVPKGDASISYVKPESVELAVEILHDGYLRPNLQISVSKAVFQKKGEEYVAKKSKVSEAKLKVAKAAAQQALSWADADDSGLTKSKALRIVVIKNMFHPEECQEEGYVEELRQDLDSECGQLGPIEKMTIFERNPEGVVVIKFGTAYAAEQCVKLMNARWFGGRQLKCYYWDGATDFTQAVWVPKKEKAAATEEGTDDDDERDEEEKRLDEFGDELDNQELPDEFALEVEGE